MNKKQLQIVNKIISTPIFINPSELKKVIDLDEISKGSNFICGVFDDEIFVSGGVEPCVVYAPMTTKVNNKYYRIIINLNI